MREERIVWVDGSPCTVVLSDEREALLAAQAAGRAVVEVSGGNRGRDGRNETEWPMISYVVEDVSAADSGYLERVARRHLGLPWRIAETERLLIREFQVKDAGAVPEDDSSGWETEDVGQRDTSADDKPADSMPVDDKLADDKSADDRSANGTPADQIFCREELLAGYIRYQYGFYEYGIWAVTEKAGGRLIGKAGVSRMGYGDEYAPPEPTDRMVVMELPDGPAVKGDSRLTGSVARGDSRLSGSAMREGSSLDSPAEYDSHGRDDRPGRAQKYDSSKCKSEEYGTHNLPVLWIEIGYHIFKPYRRKGYAAEACRGIINALLAEYGDWARCRFFAKTDASNKASVGVLRSCGFRARPYRDSNI